MAVCQGGREGGGGRGEEREGGGEKQLRFLPNP